MKKLSVFFAGLFFLMLSLTASAQSKGDTAAKPDYFVGKWEVLVEGTPQGDSKMLVNLERKDGKLTGTIGAKDGNTPASKIDRVEEKEATTHTASNFCFTALISLLVGVMHFFILLSNFDCLKDS